MHHKEPHTTLRLAVPGSCSGPMSSNVRGSFRVFFINHNRGVYYGVMLWKVRSGLCPDSYLLWALEHLAFPLGIAVLTLIK